MQEQQTVPQNIQDIIQATVDRAIATLLETGILKEKCKFKGKRNHSRSRSPSKGKKYKKKNKKRSSSSSSSSSSEDEGRKKGKEDKECGGLGKPERRSRSRSHSRGKHSRSGSRSKRHHHKRHHHHSGSPSYYHHHFHYSTCPGTEDVSEGPCPKKWNHDVGRKKHGRKFNCMRFYYKTGPATSDENNEEQRDNDSELRKTFQNLEVDSNNQDSPQAI